jgi:integrase/recombinase XerD
MLDERGYAVTTRRVRLQHIDQAERFMQATFGRRLIRAQAEHVKAFLATFEHPKSRNGARADLRSYFLFARERKYRATDPTAEIRRVREPHYLPRPLSLEQASRLRAAATTLSLRHRVVVDLALFAGPRRAEIARLRWTDIDLQARRIRFFGKGSREGVVPLHEDLATLLELWRITEPSEEWVFPSRTSPQKPLGPPSIWRLVKEAGARAGVRVTTHQLRHSFATELLEQGSDIRRVQELLRHTSLVSTQIYTAVSVGRLEGDIARLTFSYPAPA